MFVLSKLLSAITQPLFWLSLWWLLALVLLPRFRRLASSMLWTGLLTLGLLGFTAAPEALLRSLESQYRAPNLTQTLTQPLTQTLTQSGPYLGVIVLGGATGSPGIFKSHGQVPLGDAAERMTLPIALMRKFPNFELIFSGGEGRLLPTGTTEAELAKMFYEEQGVDMKRVSLESKARNTRENARQVAALLGERCKQPWLLVTSAWHMPRSMAEFEATGCNVTAYPVDFHTAEESSWTEYSMASSLMAWQTALHEYLGMFVYGLTR
jgi:uncharacterized SAM-binding protein YcdF (DUF218 family)